MDESKNIKIENEFKGNDIDTVFDLKEANVENLNNYFIAESILANHFYKNYFEFRNRKTKNLTIIKLIQIIFYACSILSFSLLSIVYTANTFITIFLVSIVFFVPTFIHDKINNEFDENKYIKKLELKSCDKGRLQFKIDFILFLIIILSIVLI